MVIQICVGSSCHLKGSQDIVMLLQEEIANRHLEDKIVLTGTLCVGKCNREGVSVRVDDEIYVGITRENFKELKTCFAKVQLLKSSMTI